MLILATNLYRKPIMDLGSHKLGELGDPIINPLNGQLLAFHVVTGPFTKKKIISLTDIVVLDPRVILVNKEDCIIDLQEIVRANQSFERKITLLKTKAFTQSNNYLGRVQDVVIDSETNCIIKYYLKYYLQDKILPADKVIEIKPNRIIFDDSVNTPTIQTEGMPA